MDPLYLDDTSTKYSIFDVAMLTTSMAAGFDDGTLELPIKRASLLSVSTTILARTG